MVKVLYLPLNSSIVQTGMYDAFRQSGVELNVLDFYRYAQKPKKRYQKQNLTVRQEFLDTVNKFRPDLIHMQLQFTSVIDGATLVQAKQICPKAIITNWTGDIRKNVPGEFIDHSCGVDISLISSVGQLELYKSKLINKDVRYWQIGYNPKLYYPINKTSFKYDISFAASKYQNSLFPDSDLRNNIVNFLVKQYGSRFGLFGNGWDNKIKAIAQSAVNNLYADSFACLSVNNFNNEYLYFSDRLLMCMASGRPTISWEFPGWQSYFSDMKNIIIVNSIDELYEKLQWLRANVSRANEIGAEGAALVLREHTYFNRVVELLRMVGLI